MTGFQNNYHGVHMVNGLDQIKTRVLKNAFVVVMKNKINMIENF